MVMLQHLSTYFDASGHPDQHKVITVAGFASNVKKWKRFEIQWKAILKRYGVEVFHMTDFASSGGEFVNWKGETTRRREFIEELVSCTKQNVNKAFRVSLIMEDYDSVNENYRLAELIGRPYAVCGTLCMYKAREWARRKKSEQTLQCYFEDGDKDKGNFEDKIKQVWKDEPQFWPIFIAKEQAAALQAADFAGWKFRNSITNALEDAHNIEKGKRLLASVEALRRIPYKDGTGVLNRTSLIAFCKSFRVPTR